MVIKKEITGARKKRKVQKLSMPNLLNLPVHPHKIVGPPMIDLPPSVIPSAISPAMPMPELETPPVVDIEKVLGQKRKSRNKLAGKKRCFDMFEKRPKKAKNPRKKRKSQDVLEQLDNEIKELDNDLEYVRC